MNWLDCSSPVAGQMARRLRKIGKSIPDSCRPTSGPLARARQIWASSERRRKVGDFFEGSRIFWVLVFLIPLTAAIGGCAQLRGGGDTGPQAPRLLPEGASLAQVLEVINRNTLAVQSYRARDARITISSLPTLRSEIAIRRPNQFRLRADMPLTGPEIDLGSNESGFWIWIRRSDPPALYHCRHDCFAASPAYQQVPINPQWFIEALGLVTFDPAGKYVGPTPLSKGRLEIRSQVQISGEELAKITVVDAARGWVLEQHVYNPRGELIASSIASQHSYDPVHRVSLPQRVKVQIPRAQLIMQVDMGPVAINEATADPPELFSRPVYPGFTSVDLCPPQFTMPAGTVQPPATDSQPPFAPGTASAWPPSRLPSSPR